SQMRGETSSSNLKKIFFLQAPNLVFLAVSPEEKESWVNALSIAIIKAKNRVLDEVTIEEDSTLVHPTRDRAKIPYGRRLPTRGHLMAVASTSSHGMLTLDLVAEEDVFSHDYDGDWNNSFRVDLQGGGSCGQIGVGGRQRAGTDVSKLRMTSKEPKVKTSSLPRGSERSWGKHLDAQYRTPQPGKRFSMQGRSRCASMDEVLSSRYDLVINKVREYTDAEFRLSSAESSGSPRSRSSDSPRLRGRESPRSKAKKNRSKGNDSPHSRGSHAAAAKVSDSPRLSGSPRSKSTDAARSPKLKGPSAASPNKQGSSPIQKPSDSPLSVGRSDFSQVKGYGSPRGSETDSPHLGSNEESPLQSQNSPTLSRSFESSQPRTPDSHHPSPLPPATQLSEDNSEVEQRRAEAERLLEEAVSSWKEAQEVLQEVKELQSQTLRRQRRRTYEKMASAAAAAGIPAPSGAAEEIDTLISPTSPEDKEDSETPERGV
uniref:PH domain-containing protein n=1 Tax=Haplochromis burtoni TaxID=8153 RepID=A0A3Q2VPI4_HAPBU